MREIHFIAGVPRIGVKAGLIGSRIDDGPDQMPQVELVLDEILGQSVQQRRIAGRIRGTNVVHGLDDPPA